MQISKYLRQNALHSILYFFINFHMCFSYGEGCNGNSRMTWTSFQQPLIGLLAPHQSRTKQGQKCNHATWSLIDPVLLSCGCRQQGLPCQLVLGLSGHMADHHSWDLSIRRSGARLMNFTAAYFVMKCHAMSSSQKS